MKRLLTYTPLVFLLCLMVFSGCKKTNFDPTFDDLVVSIDVEVLPDGDVLFTYTEDNFSEHRIDYSRGTACPADGIEVYQNDSLVDRVVLLAICTDDIPRGFLSGGTAFEQEVNWLNEPTHSPLPAGTYQARCNVRVGIIHYVGAPNESTEWRNLELETEFTID